MPDSGRPWLTGHLVVVQSAWKDAAEEEGGRAGEPRYRDLPRSCRRLMSERAAEPCRNAPALKRLPTAPSSLRLSQPAFYFRGPGSAPSACGLAAYSQASAKSRLTAEGSRERAAATSRRDHFQELRRIPERYGKPRFQLLPAIEPSSLHPHTGKEAIHRLNRDAQLAD